MEKKGSDTKTPGALKGGVEGHVFDLANLPSVDAGTGYSTARGPVVEGETIQVGLISKPRGTGARLHKHPNEQWNYVLKGKLRVSIEGEEDQIAGPGTVVYLPANRVHSTVATTDEDVLFLAIKDMSHGIVGMAADGTMSGPHYEPGFSPEEAGSDR